MHSLFRVVICVLATIGLPGVADAANAVREVVPAGTAVPLRVVGEVSSRTAHAGDTIQLQVAADVIVNGMVVVPANADGEGEIVSVDHAGGNGHSATLELHFDWVHAADGGKIALSAAPQKQAEEDRTGASSTATIVGFAAFGLGGLFGHNFAHGREVTIDTKTMLTAFTANTVHVRSTTRAAAGNDRYDR